MLQKWEDQALMNLDLQNTSVQEWNVGHAQGSPCPAWFPSHHKEQWVFPSKIGHHSCGLQRHPPGGGHSEALLQALWPEGAFVPVIRSQSVIRGGGGTHRGQMLSSQLLTPCLPASSEVPSPETQQSVKRKGVHG